jgi:RNA polymerase sigma-70 factor (ECF subfamily)
MSVSAESQLVARCLQGEAAAWDELFAVHYAPAGRFVAQLSPDFTREDVEEVCQEVFISVIRHLSSFDGRSRIQTWIFRIAANKARDFREKAQAAKRGGGVRTLSLQEENPETGLTLDLPDSGPGPDAALLLGEDVALVGRALEALGPQCREVIELRYFGDLSYEEIAAELEMNPKTVSSRLSKCLDRLEKIARQMIRREKSAPTSV